MLIWLSGLPYAPQPALEREGVHVEHHHAAAQVAVGDVHLARRLVEPDLLEAAHHHRRRRRVLGPERRHERGLLGRIGAAAAAARLRLGHARQFLHQHAGLRVVLADRVRADVDEALAVHVHAMPLHRVERADHGAVLVDVDQRGRTAAAVGGRRIESRVPFDVERVVRTVQHPDVVVLVDREPGDAAHLPLVRQRLRPGRIEDVAGRRLRVGGRGEIAWCDVGREQAGARDRQSDPGARLVNEINHATSPGDECAASARESSPRTQGCQLRAGDSYTDGKTATPPSA